MNETHHILIVEDEPVAGKAMAEYLSGEGLICHLFETGEEAIGFISDHPVSTAILDVKLPGISGIDIFHAIQKINREIPVIFVTAYSSVSDAVELLKMGAFTYLQKPIEMASLFHNVKQALEKFSLLEENQRLHLRLMDKFAVDNYIFHSEKMRTLMETINQAADSSANILVTGESGTGKEIIANLIHHLSARKNRGFVKVNLAAIPATLMEAELFGAEKGAYTGAAASRKGKFEEASGGTIFLDEIGDLPPEIQVSLLRVIQEREVVRLGSNTAIPVNIRLVTATNRDLEKMVREGSFREDLFFRLNVINLHLPPLRERIGEIELLIQHFINKFNQREHKEVSGITPDAVDFLRKYDFPGNIRELENIIERAVILNRTGEISQEDFPPSVKKSGHRFLSTQDRDTLSLPERLHQLEKEIILDTLKENGFNQLKTAKKLGISESGLRYRMKTLDIDGGSSSG